MEPAIITSIIGAAAIILVALIKWQPASMKKDNGFIRIPECAARHEGLRDMLASIKQDIATLRQEINTRQERD